MHRLVGLAVLLLAAAPASAGAATVTGSPGVASDRHVPGASPRIEYAGAPGEANALTVSRDGSDVVFREAALPIAATGLCRSLTPQEARCPVVAAGPQVIRTLLADGDDTLRVTGPLGAVALDLDGGDGDDSITGPSATTSRAATQRPDLLTYFGGSGNDTIQGGPDDETLDGGPGEDTLRAGPGEDALTGDAGADALSGEAGDDRLTGDASEDPIAPDVLDGGPGRDRAIWETSAPVRVDLADPAPDGRAQEGEILRGIEDVQGGTGANTLLGDGGPNLLTGGRQGRAARQAYSGRGGDDVLVTAAGDTTFDGGVVLSGGPRDDRLEGDGRPSCGSGRDVIFRPTGPGGLRAVRDCELARIGAVAVELRPRVTSRDVLLRVFRVAAAPEDVVDTAAVARRRRPISLYTHSAAATSVARRTARFPGRAGTTLVVPLTAKGRRLLAGGRPVLVDVEIGDALNALMVLER